MAEAAGRGISAALPRRLPPPAARGGHPPEPRAPPPPLPLTEGQPRAAKLPAATAGTLVFLKKSISESGKNPSSSFHARKQRGAGSPEGGLPPASGSAPLPAPLPPGGGTSLRPGPPHPPQAWKAAAPRRGVPPPHGRPAALASRRCPRRRRLPSGTPAALTSQRCPPTGRLPPPHGAAPRPPGAPPPSPHGAAPSPGDSRRLTAQPAAGRHGNTPPPPPAPFKAADSPAAARAPAAARRPTHLRKYRCPACVSAISQPGGSGSSSVTS